MCARGIKQVILLIVTVIVILIVIVIVILIVTVSNDLNKFPWLVPINRYQDSALTGRWMDGF